MKVPKKRYGLPAQCSSRFGKNEEQNQASVDLMKQAKGFKQGLCL